MKTFKKYIIEALKPAVKAENIEKDALDATKYLEVELKKVLGDRYVIQVAYTERLGKSLNVRIYDNKPVNNIPQNSPVFMQFIMHLTNSYGKDEDLDKVSWIMLTGPRSVLYRKTSSKDSIKAASFKLIQWIYLNKVKFDALLKEDVQISEEFKVVIPGNFDRKAIAKQHKKKPLKVGDVVVSRKGEEFKIQSISPGRKYLNGKFINVGQDIELVGLKKGKVFIVNINESVGQSVPGLFDPFKVRKLYKNGQLKVGVILKSRNGQEFKIKEIKPVKKGLTFFGEDIILVNLKTKQIVTIYMMKELPPTVNA